MTRPSGSTTAMLSQFFVGRTLPVWWPMASINPSAWYSFRISATVPRWYSKAAFFAGTVAGRWCATGWSGSPIETEKARFACLWSTCCWCQGTAQNSVGYAAAWRWPPGRLAGPRGCAQDRTIGCRLAAARKC